MQMFVYEMTQMMVARGGQLVFSSVQLSPGVPKLWRDKPCVYKGRVWNGKEGVPEEPMVSLNGKSGSCSKRSSR